MQHLSSGARSEPLLNGTTVSNNSRFRYGSPKLESTQIRVLSIAPDTLQGVISCELQVVDLSKPSLAYLLWHDDGNSKATPEVGASTRDAWHKVSLRLRAQLEPGEYVIDCSDRESDQSDESQDSEDMSLGSADLNVGAASKASNRITEYRDEDFELGCHRFEWGDYIALSYVWGTDGPKKHILVNGAPFGVSKNLYNALLMLRDSERVQRRRLKVWVDAICINQENLEERGREVKKMAKIYSTAWSVVAWLGQPPAHFNEPFQIIKAALAEVRYEDMAAQRYPYVDQIARNNPTDIDPASFYNALLCLFQVPYWNRLWIIQETLLAPALIFTYGNHVMTVLQLLKYQYAWQKYHTRPLNSRLSPDILEIMASVQPATTRLMSANTRGMHHAMSQLDVVRLTRMAKATDLRDKVYGILALLPLKVSNEIEPDYRKDVTAAAVYTSLSEAYIKAEGSLNLIARTKTLGNITEDLPSWIIDFRGPPRPLGEAGPVKHEEARIFRTSSGLKAEFIFSEQDGPQRLSTNGVFIDEVKSLAATMGTFLKPVFHNLESDKVGILGAASTKELSIEEQPKISIKSDKRLSLARTLFLNSRYCFEDGPSILDMPWPEASTFAGLDARFDTGSEFEPTNPKSWQSIHRHEMSHLAKQHLLPNADFHVFGAPLKSFFSSRDANFTELPGILNASSHASRLLLDRRLCNTRDGRAGLVPLHAEPGDKIAILFGCDMPLALRPDGLCYRLVGPCYVDGLMEGEAVPKISSGELKSEIISLC